MNHRRLSTVLAGIPRVALLLLVLANPVLQVTADDLPDSYCFPLGITTGQTSQVDVASVPRWPLNVHCSDNSLQWKAKSTKGSFDVTVPHGGLPRLVWFRLYDAKGAGPWLPLAISTEARVREQEPNDQLDQATAVTLPAIVDGRLGKSGDVDSVAVALQAGDRLAIRLTANWIFNSPVDAVLQVTDARHNVLLQNHDDRGLDPGMVFDAPRTATYFVRCFGFPSQPNTSIRFSGSPSYVYQLELTRGPMLDGWVPAIAPVKPDADQRLRQQPSVATMAVGWNLPANEREARSPLQRDQGLGFDGWQWTGQAGWLGLGPWRPSAAQYHTVHVPDSCSAEHPLAVSPPVSATGILQHDHDTDAFRFRASAGSAWRFRVQSESIGFRADPWLRIVDANGKQVAEFDDTNRQPDLDVTWKAPAGGEYVAIVADRFYQGTPRSLYVFDIEPREPGLRMHVAKQHLEATGGKPLTIKIQLERSDGFASDCGLVLEGLPEGLPDPQVHIKGKQAKEEITVTLPIPAAYAGRRSFPLRIVARQDNRVVAVATADNARAFAPADEFWVTIAAPK